MKDKIKIGIIGFGHIGRYVYLNTLNNPNLDVAAISDIGKLDVLHYLLANEPRNKCDVSLSVEQNCLIYNGEKTIFVDEVSPGNVDWSALNVDWVIDATGKFLTKKNLQKHIDLGAKKVILSCLPDEDLDNLIIPGINNHQINSDDKIISVGSSTTNALALMLNILNKAFEIECASMTTIHSYTNDQPLQDSAGTDFRRSRSAAKNIIPNENYSYKWVGKVLPVFKDKIISSALNVPVQFGSLMDLTTVFKQDIDDVEKINNAVIAASLKFPDLIKVAKDPIVSSDVIGMKETIIYDEIGTLKIGKNMIKTLVWYDNGYNHASRILDVISLYEGLKQ